MRDPALDGGEGLKQPVKTSVMGGSPDHLPRDLGGRGKIGEVYAVIHNAPLVVRDGTETAKMAGVRVGERGDDVDP